MSEKARANRVAELVREEIAKLLTKGIKDPRVGFVSVMSVRMSSDLHYANVYVSLFGSESERKSSLIALRNSASWMRREVGKYLRMRYTPEIRFFPDETLDKVYHLEEVFEQIHAQQQQQPMLDLTIEQVVDELRLSDSLLLTTHVNPDGDAIGSLLGMYHLLRGMGKTSVSMVVDGAAPRVYQRLPGIKHILNAEAIRPFFDTVVLVDCSGYDRIGAVADWISPGVKVLILDHHTEPGAPGAMGHIDATYAAAGELVIQLFAEAGVVLSPEAAHCLYVAQATDTGGYRFSNTTARTHELAAQLIRAGVDVGAVSKDVLNIISRPKFELLRRVLNRAEMRCGGALAASWITTEDLDDAMGTREDCEGLINYLKQVEGVRVAALFTATTTSQTKVSLRSDAGFDSAAFMRAFGGGGHVAAAGGTLEMSLGESINDVLGALESTLCAGGPASLPGGGRGEAKP